MSPTSLSWQPCTLWTLITVPTLPSSSLCSAPLCPPCFTWSCHMSMSYPRWTWLSSTANWVGFGNLHRTHKIISLNDTDVGTAIKSQTHSPFCCCVGPAFNLDFYTEVMDLSYLLDHLAADPFFKKFKLLNEKIAEVIQDYSLVSFVPLNVQVWHRWKISVGLSCSRNGPHSLGSSVE